MIIKTNYVFKGFDAFTVWPFIFVRPEAVKEPSYDGLIEHEMVHYKEQRKCLTIPWVLRYLCSKEFRLNAEVRAYKRQIAVGGISTNVAAYQLQKYKLGVSYIQAKQLLQKK